MCQYISISDSNTATSVSFSNAACLSYQQVSYALANCQISCTSFNLLSKVKTSRYTRESAFKYHQPEGLSPGKLIPLVLNCTHSF